MKKELKYRSPRPIKALAGAVALLVESLPIVAPIFGFDMRETRPYNEETALTPQDIVNSFINNIKGVSMISTAPIVNSAIKLNLPTRRAKVVNENYPILLPEILVYADKLIEVGPDGVARKINLPVLSNSQTASEQLPPNEKESENESLQELPNEQQSPKSNKFSKIKEKLKKAKQITKKAAKISAIPATLATGVVIGYSSGNKGDDEVNNSEKNDTDSFDNNISDTVVVEKIIPKELENKSRQEVLDWLTNTNSIVYNDSVQ